MKKIALLVIIPMILPAQTILSDSLMLRMRKHLYVNKNAIDSTTISRGNLFVHSLLTRELINPGDTLQSVDILSFNGPGTPLRMHVAYIYPNKWQIVNMNRSYAEILHDLLSFFEQNPEIDDRLLPLFNHMTYRVFLINTTHHQTGKWYDWWHRRDSLSRQLNCDILGEY